MIVMKEKDNNLFHSFILINKVQFRVLTLTIVQILGTNGAPMLTESGPHDSPLLMIQS